MKRENKNVYAVENLLSAIEKIEKRIAEIENKMLSKFDNNPKGTKSVDRGGKKNTTKGDSTAKKG